jgi:hypothetical protein
MLPGTVKRFKMVGFPVTWPISYLRARDFSEALLHTTVSNILLDAAFFIEQLRQM